MTVEQNELYQSILDRDIRSFLENKHLAKVSSSGTVTPNKRKSVSPDEEEESATTTPQTRSGISTPMSRSSSMRSTRKKQRTSYREMTDDEWYTAMAKAESEQFKTPPPEPPKLTQRISRPTILTCRKILWESESSEYDYAAS